MLVKKKILRLFTFTFNEGIRSFLSPEVKYNGVLYQVFGTFLCSSEAVQM